MLRQLTVNDFPLAYVYSAIISLHTNTEVFFVKNLITNGISFEIIVSGSK